MHCCTYSLYFSLCSVDFFNTDMVWNNLFQVLREGNKGYGILVSSAPKESNAIYSLRDPSEVNLSFLTEFIYFVWIYFFVVICSFFILKKLLATDTVKCYYIDHYSLCIMLVLFGPDINLPYMIVSTGHGISQVTCVVEIKHLKKPYIVYRGREYTLLY